MERGDEMSAQDRLTTLETRLCEIEAEAKALRIEHDVAAAAGKDSDADKLAGKIRTLRQRAEDHELRRTALEAEVAREESQHRASEGKEAAAQAVEMQARFQSAVDAVASAAAAVDRAAAALSQLQPVAIHMQATRARALGAKCVLPPIEGYREAHTALMRAAHVVAHAGDSYGRASVIDFQEQPKKSVAA